MMANITLNLLSPAKKSKLNQLVKFLFVKNLLEFTVIVISLLATVLLWSWMVLVEEYNYLAASAVLINHTDYVQNRGIREVNRLTTDVVEAGRGYLQLTPYLTQIINLIPADIKVSALGFNRRTGEFYLLGTAKTRSALIDFRARTETIDWLEKAAAPVSSLLQKENINFEWKSQIKGWPALRPLPPEAAKR